MKGNAKIKLALQKQAAGKAKQSTARNTKELKDQLLQHNFKTTYRKVQGLYSTENAVEFHKKELQTVAALEAERKANKDQFEQTNWNHR